MAIATNAFARKIVRELMHKPYHADMFAAHVSFCEGVGAFSYARSQVLARHNTGDYAGSAKAFVAPWATKVSGAVQDWLVEQRKEEQALYEAGMEKMLRKAEGPVELDYYTVFSAAAIVIILLATLFVSFV